MENLELIIGKVGNISEVARMLKLRHSNVIFAWRKVGKIPDWRINDVNRLAKKLKLI